MALRLGYTAELALWVITVIREQVFRLQTLSYLHLFGNIRVGTTNFLHDAVVKVNKEWLMRHNTRNGPRRLGKEVQSIDLTVKNNVKDESTAGAFQMQIDRSEEPDARYLPHGLKERALTESADMMEETSGSVAPYSSELLLDLVFVWSVMCNFHILAPRFDLHSYFQDIPIMRQVFPIRQERSKPHLLQPAVAHFLRPQGCDAPHEVEQDDAAEHTMPSMMRRYRVPAGRELTIGNVLGACAPSPPSIASVTAAPTETSQLERADLAIRNVTASPVPAIVVVSSTAPQVTPRAIPESPRPIVVSTQSTTDPSTAAQATPTVIPESLQLTTPATRSTADPAASSPGKWICPLRPPPCPLDPQSLSLPLKWEKRAIRSQKECIADLYIHQNDRESVRQIWMWTGHQWDAVKPDCTHPIMSEYRLKILEKGEPSWVMRKTMVSDQGRAKQEIRKVTLDSARLGRYG
ncbi:hypothetical protein EDD15DRAFT_2191383 [Pisolithus albus]|nr:hypothetical protein EDD15DRAFT_2191383 [Pisolithus albus]